MKAVYCVGILDFTFDDYENEPEKNEVVHTIKLKNQHGKVFYDKLTYIYLEMPNFKQTETDLTTRLDKWLYFIKYLEDFQSIPTIFSDEVFTQAFEKAELAKYGQAELDSYENSLKIYRDLKGVIETAFDEGKLEGRLEEKLEVVKAAKLMGLSTAEIMKLTGLSESEINRLQIQIICKYQPLPVLLRAMFVFSKTQNKEEPSILAFICLLSNLSA